MKWLFVRLVATKELRVRGSTSSLVDIGGRAGRAGRAGRGLFISSMIEVPTFLR